MLIDGFMHALNIELLASFALLSLSILDETFILFIKLEHEVMEK